MTEVNAAAYQETRHRVYDLVREWEDIERSVKVASRLLPLLGVAGVAVDSVYVSSIDPVFRNPAVKAHFERLAGPYGRAYYYMLKEQQKAE
jgi:hypothetical protein